MRTHRELPWPTLSGPARPLALAILVVACGGGSEPGERIFQGTDPSDDAQAEVPAPSPDWTAADVAAGIEEALSTGVPNPFQAREAYLSYMALGNEFCPGDETQLTDDVILGCETEDGVLFIGISELYAMGPVEAASLDIGDLWVLAGDFSITDTAGQSIRVGGGVSWTRMLDEAGEPGPWAMELGGTWVDTAREDWLGLGASVVFFVEGTEDPGSLWLDGGLGIGAHDLFFDELLWPEAACGQPEGHLSIRGPDTWWYTWAPAADCSGCGPVTFQDGRELGEACLDLSGTYDTYQALVADQ